jgi:hypothetical protein
MLATRSLEREMRDGEAAQQLTSLARTTNGSFAGSRARLPDCCCRPQVMQEESEYDADESRGYRRVGDRYHGGH